MTVKEIKSISEIFTEIVAKRDKEHKYRVARELDNCESIEEQIQRDNDIMMSKVRETAFQEVLNIIMEKK